jgi:uncharacterized membrane protein YdbT with pleckstrin-like domain
MMLVIIFALGYVYYLGYGINKIALIAAGIFVIGAFKFTEIHRFKDWWAISAGGLVQSTGIFDKNVREIAFSSISDLDVDQPFFKRILGYGDVNVRLFLNETSIKIININRPERFIEKLQEIMNTRREGKNDVRRIP